jgi:hypothetical protein
VKRIKPRCQHGKNKYACKECGGKAFCSHGNFKGKCKECKSDVLSSGLGGSDATVPQADVQGPEVVAVWSDFVGTLISTYLTEPEILLP